MARVEKHQHLAADLGEEILELKAPHCGPFLPGRVIVARQKPVDLIGRHNTMSGNEDDRDVSCRRLFLDPVEPIKHRVMGPLAIRRRRTKNHCLIKSCRAFSYCLYEVLCVLYRKEEIHFLWKIDVD